MTEYPDDYWCIEHKCWLNREHLEKYHKEEWNKAVTEAIEALMDDCIYREAGYRFVKENDGFVYDGGTM